jgi:hypothetical protein
MNLARLANEVKLAEMVDAPACVTILACIIRPSQLEKRSSVRLTEATTCIPGLYIQDTGAPCGLDIKTFYDPKSDALSSKNGLVPTK